MKWLTLDCIVWILRRVQPLHCLFNPQLPSNCCCQALWRCVPHTHNLEFGQGSTWEGILLKFLQLSSSTSSPPSACSDSSCLSPRLDLEKISNFPSPSPGCILETTSNQKWWLPRSPQLFRSQDSCPEPSVSVCSKTIPLCIVPSWVIVACFLKD